MRYYIGHAGYIFQDAPKIIPISELISNRKCASILLTVFA